MNVLDKYAGYLAYLCQVVLCAALSIMTLITFIEVVRRYFFGASFAWAEELIRFLLVWVTFLGGSAAFYKGDLIYFDMLTAKLSPSMQKYFSILVCFLLFAIIGVFFSYSLNYAYSRPIQMQNSPGLGLPLYYVYISIPVGLGLMLFYNLCRLLRLLRALAHKGATVCS